LRASFRLPLAQALVFLLVAGCDKKNGSPSQPGTSDPGTSPSRVESEPPSSEREDSSTSGKHKPETDPAIERNKQGTSDAPPENTNDPAEWIEMQDALQAHVKALFAALDMASSPDADSLSRTLASELHWIEGELKSYKTPSRALRPLENTAKEKLEQHRTLLERARDVWMKSVIFDLQVLRRRVELVQSVIKTNLDWYAENKAKLRKKGELTRYVQNFRGWHFEPHTKQLDEISTAITESSASRAEKARKRLEELEPGWKQFRDEYADLKHAQSMVWVKQSGGRNFDVIEVLPGDELLADVSGAIMRSTDHGRTWKTTGRTEYGSSGARMQYDADSRLLTLMHENFRETSTDEGKTWKSAKDKHITIMRDQILGSGPYPGGIKGHSWHYRKGNRPKLLEGGVFARNTVIGEIRCVWFLDEQAKEFLIATSEGLFRGEESGKSLKPLHRTACDTLLVDSSDGRRILAAGTGVVLLSTDGGATWRIVAKGLNDPSGNAAKSYFVQSMERKELICYVVESCRAIVTRDGGEKWFHADGLDDRTAERCAAPFKKSILLGTSSGVYALQDADP